MIRKKEKKSILSLGVSKKANALIDGITILVVLFVMAIGGVIALNVFDEVNTDIQADETLTQDAKDTSSGLYNKFPNLMDNLFLFAFVLLIIVTAALVFMIDTHPVFFIISIVLLGGLFVVGLNLANSYDDLMQDSELSPYANQFPYTSWIMSHLVEEIIAIGFLLSLVMFIKFKG